MQGSIFPSSMDTYVDVTILNHSTIVFKSNQAASQAILALEVFDKAGECMLTIPLSMSIEEAEIIIKPSEAFLTTYDLHISSPSL